MHRRTRRDFEQVKHIGGLRDVKVQSGDQKCVLTDDTGRPMRRFGFGNEMVGKRRLFFCWLRDCLLTNLATHVLWDSGFVIAIEAVIRSAALLCEQSAKLDALRCFLKCDDLHGYLLSGGISNQC
jgi:hypothetical protein